MEFTRKELYQRYSVDILDKVLVEFNSSLNHAFQIEQILKNKFFNKIISKEEQIDNFGWTETIKDVPFSILYNEFEKLKLIKETELIFEHLKNDHNY